MWGARITWEDTRPQSKNLASRCTSSSSSSMWRPTVRQLSTFHVVTRMESSQVRIVCRRINGDWSGTPLVCVAQTVCQILEPIRCKLVLITHLANKKSKLPLCSNFETVTLLQYLSRLKGRTKTSSSPAAGRVVATGTVPQQPALQKAPVQIWLRHRRGTGMEQSAASASLGLITF